MRPFARHLLAASLALSLSGCHPERVVDATDLASLHASLDAMAEVAPPARREALQLARQRFAALYESSPDGEQFDEALPHWFALHGAKADDFIAFVEDQHYLINPPEQAPLWPNPGLATRMFDQMTLERDLLIQARDRIVESGRQTVDQYPILDFTFIPPMDDMPMELDKARFLVTIRNDSGFDAYKPSFHVVIREPGSDLSVLEKDFHLTSLREPIGPGQTVRLQFTCCSLQADPFHNQLLKQLSSSATLETHLTGIRDHSNVELLLTTGYDIDDHERLQALNTCLAELQGSEATWVPPPIDQPICPTAREREQLSEIAAATPPPASSSSSLSASSRDTSSADASTSPSRTDGTSN